MTQPAKDGVLPHDPRSRKILLLLLLCLCAMSATIFAYAFYNEWYVLETRVVPMRVVVPETQNIGFDLNNTIITFGKVPRGSSSTRGVTFAGLVSARASWTVRGDIASWVVPRSDSVDLPPNEPLSVPFTVMVPYDAPFGTIDGELVIIYTRRLW